MRNISQVVKDSSSEYNYMTLLKKVSSTAETATKEDLYYLYYGQLFYKRSTGLSFLTNPEIEEFQRLVSSRKFKKALPVGYAILQNNPVELSTLLQVNQCINKAKQQDVYSIGLRLKMLLEAILSTGDGKSVETAIKIVDVQDGYILKDLLNFTDGTQFLEANGGRAISGWEKKGRKLYFEEVWTYELLVLSN